jgi:hypothetical protein
MRFPNNRLPLHPIKFGTVLSGHFIVSNQYSSIIVLDVIFLISPVRPNTLIVSPNQIRDVPCQ